MLEAGEVLPREFTRPEVAQILGEHARQQRERRARRGVTMLFTGLSGAGKTTISSTVMARLKERGCLVERLDGDVIRQNLSKGLGFSKEDRDENIRRVGFVCHLLSRNGVVAMMANIAPFRSVREELRSRIEDFVEVYVRCPLDVCEERDVKGLYTKARAGLIKEFTGIDSPYEEPEHPEVICDTDREAVEESVNKVLEKLLELGYLE